VPGSDLSRSDPPRYPGCRTAGARGPGSGSHHCRTRARFCVARCCWDAQGRERCVPSAAYPASQRCCSTPRPRPRSAPGSCGSNGTLQARPPPRRQTRELLGHRRRPPLWCVRQQCCGRSSAAVKTYLGGERESRAQRCDAAHCDRRHRLALFVASRHSAPARGEGVVRAMSAVMRIPQAATLFHLSRRRSRYSRWRLSPRHWRALPRCGPMSSSQQPMSPSQGV
jgi:hypothetical protein